MYKIFIAILITISIGACNRNNVHEQKEWGAIYKNAGIDSAGFEIYEQAKERAFYYNKPWGNRRTIPASTFKIFLSLVALETSVAPDEDFIIRYNGKSCGNAAWDKDLTLREAFKLSSEPYYKSIATSIGRIELQKWMDSIKYGNMKMGDDITACWHDSSLLITPDEQVGFLKKLYFDELPFSKRTQRLVRSIMLQETTPQYKLYFKTGTHNSPSTQMAWMVGFLEDSTNHPYFFANNFETKDSSMDLMDTRLKTTKAIFNSIGLMR
jgi:beta-lactamase class D